MAEAPLTIVQVAAPAPVGGLERVVQSLAIGHHREGHRVTVIAILDPGVRDHPFTARLREEGVAVEELRIPPRGYLRERREVRRVLERIRPDVVHTHGYRCDLLDGGVARALGCRVVSTLHGSSRLGGKSHALEWLQLRALRRFDAVVAVSRPLVAMLEGAGVPRERIALIPNAWPGVEPRLTRAEARARLGLPEDRYVVGFVGRLIPAKGPDILLEALPLLPAALPWHACFIGDGLLRDSLERRVAELGIGGRVTFAGHQDDATDLYRAFDVFVLSSRTEGTPIALLEAMGAGVPVVATAVGGVPDVLGEAPEGWLVVAGDASGIASGVRRHAADRERSLVGARALAAMVRKRFHVDRWLRIHAILYRVRTPLSVESRSGQ